MANPDNNFQLEILGITDTDSFIGIIEKDGMLYAQVDRYSPDDEDEDDYEEYQPDLLEIFV